MQCWTYCTLALRKKSMEFFWHAFSCIRTEYRVLLFKSPLSVRMRENTDQKNCKYGYFLRSVVHNILLCDKKKQEHSISMLGKKKLSHNRTSQKKQKTVWRYWQITWCTLAPYVLNSVNELDVNLKWSDKKIFYPMQDQQIMNSILINILLNSHCSISLSNLMVKINYTSLH